MLGIKTWYNMQDFHRYRSQSVKASSAVSEKNKSGA